MPTTARAERRLQPSDAHPRRRVENVDVARMFDEVADLLEIQGENPFRIRPDRAAARTMETLGRPESELAGEGSLHELPGIGADLAAKIATILETGTCPLLEELTRKTPETLVQMLRIPGLGPKRARQLYERLGITTLAELEAAARSGRLRTLRGVKEALEQKILHGIAALQGSSRRWRLSEAEAYVQGLVQYLRGATGVREPEVAGSYRRRRETVGDIDILVASSRPREVATRFIKYARVKEVLAKGATRSSIVLDCTFKSRRRTRRA